MNAASVAILLGLSTAIWGCSSGSEIGEACTESGTTDECVEGAMCDTLEGGSTVCLEICENQEDCPAGENCNGTSGSNVKTCHPEDDPGN